MPMKLSPWIVGEWTATEDLGLTPNPRSGIEQRHQENTPGPARSQDDEAGWRQGPGAHCEPYRPWSGSW